jgi:hypothetical protein
MLYHNKQMEYIEVPYSNGTTEKIPKKGQWAGNDGSLWNNGKKLYSAGTLNLSEVLEIRRQADIMSNQVSSNHEQPSILPANNVSQQTDDSGKISVIGESATDHFNYEVTGSTKFPLAGAPPHGEGRPEGVFSVPKCGSRVWVFFHGGDIQKPVYFAYSLAPTDHQNFYGNPPPEPSDEKTSSLQTLVQPDNQSTQDNIVEEPLPTEVPLATEVPSQTQAPLTIRNFSDNNKFTQ